MHSDSSQEGIPLMVRDEYVHDFHQGVAHVHAQPFKLEDDLDELGPAPRRSSRWAILLALACAVTALSLVFNAVTFVRSTSARSSRAAEKLDTSKLRRPSLYLGLERVPELLQEHQSPVSHDEPSSAPAGWPSRVARVNSAYPQHAFPQDGWVVLTEQDRTIMDFDAIAGKPGQRCTLRAFFPTRRELRDKLLTMERDDGVAPDPAIRFTARTLSPLDISDVTWNTRPSATRLVDMPLTLTAAFGHNQSTVAFPCPTSGTLRVEAMCIGGGCRVEYDASPGLVNVDPLLGIQLIYV
ncbi:hypothetical protein PsYK624_024590 [Phanerochaete sordida]|uniref:Ubiquitin 3 binding protein But2 C-terminal domain-containing protein n=1 Tax=Phanerochaete sordida TaxID=48140 RepID=A0A9P3L9C5_9APHY|nr:hypothetical protein PsYK624_024590 [Phanerochaete sordida]